MKENVYLGTYVYPLHSTQNLCDIFAKVTHTNRLNKWFVQSDDLFLKSQRAVLNYQLEIQFTLRAAVKYNNKCSVIIILVVQ